MLSSRRQKMISGDIVDRALALAAEGGGNYEYFFAQLKTPDWIAFLKERGRFSHPPVAIFDGSYIRFPGWPEGDYLARMAELAPKEVFDAIEDSAYGSDNHTVHQVLLQIAVKLPADLSANIAGRETNWLSGQLRLYGLYPERGADLIRHLATNGESNAALGFLAEMLNVRRPPESDVPVTLIGGEPLRWSVDPVAKIDIWNLDQTTTGVSQSLAESVPEGLLSVLSDLLDRAITIHDNNRGNKEDFSTIWRPQIARGNNRDVLDVLASGLQRATQIVTRTHNDGYTIAARVFDQHKWPVFRRFEAYAFANAEDVPQAVMERLLLDDEQYISATANPEFAELLGRWFAAVSEEAKQKILQIVDAGPDLSRYSNYLAQQEAQGKRSESESWLRGEWRLRWLTPITNDLDEVRRQATAELTEKYGAPRPDYVTGGARAIGHSSDISDAEFRKLGPQELVQYLVTWTPPPIEHPEAPSRGGLAQVVGRWLSDQPSFFTDHLALFLRDDLHPTYLRTMFDGFAAALKTDKQFDVFAVVRAINWVLENTKASSREGFKWEEDPGWSWSYMSSARFLTELFLHPDRLEVGRHRELWPTLELMAQSENPTAEDEKDYRSKNDFGMLALNSTRPVALEAVMRYARWLKLADTGLSVSAGSLPEVFALLSTHLDPAVDDSVAVREMFGMQFGLLGWLDRGWLESQLHALFPPKPHRILDKFAWNAFLRFSNPIADMLPAMRFRYERAINGLDIKAATVGDSERSLGNHLMSFVALGTIAMEDSLVESFFKKASLALRGQTIGDIGWHLGRENQALDEGTRDRLMGLWETRLQHCVEEGSAARKEMAAFGWWLHSKKFPDAWTVEQAIVVVDTFRELGPDFAVIERFAELAEKYPFDAAHCLGVIFEEDKEGWAIHGWGEHTTTILEAALRGSAQSHAEAVRVINLLVARGNRSFRRLLESK
jgi:hypothetical protein